MLGLIFTIVALAGALLAWIGLEYGIDRKYMRRYREKPKDRLPPL